MSGADTRRPRDGGHRVVVTGLGVLLGPDLVGADALWRALCRPADAPVTMIEVSDFNCTHCRDFNRDTAPVLEAMYVEPGKVRYISHVFGFNQQSQAVAASALCANDQGKYFEFQREAFDNQSEDGADPTIEDYLAWGENIGVERAAFEACVREGRAASVMGARTASRVWLTPSTILRKSPWCRVASARVARRPSTPALASVAASATRRLTASMQVLRFSLMALKSPA